MDEPIQCSECECPDVQVPIWEELDENDNTVWACINSTSISESDVYWCPECGHVSEVTDPSLQDEFYQDEENDWFSIGGAR